MVDVIGTQKYWLGLLVNANRPLLYRGRQLFSKHLWLQRSYCSPRHPGAEVRERGVSGCRGEALPRGARDLHPQTKVGERPFPTSAGLRSWALHLGWVRQSQRCSEELGKRPAAKRGIKPQRITEL